MIHILGINHNSASLSVREKFAFTKDHIVSFSNKLQVDGEINEIVVLSTCNRTELYFTQNTLSDDEAFHYMYEQLSAYLSVEGDYSEYFYRHSEEDAVRHLFEVSSGLDSMLFGEDQIISQVKDAYLFSTDMGFTEAILMRLFQKSFEAGKRVRSETPIKSGTTSISHLAVEIIQREYLTLDQSPVMVIGAGKAAELVIAALKKKKVKQLAIANRSLENARELLGDYPGSALRLDEITEHISSYHAIVSAISTQKTLISEKDIRERVSAANGKTHLLIDISAPATIEKPSSAIPGVDVYQIDDLKEKARRNEENRRQYLGETKEIVQEVVDDFMKWYAQRSLRPAIQTITNNLGKISEKELTEYLKINANEEQEILKTFSANLTQKYIRMFIRNLKEIKDSSHQKNYLEFIERLFKISD